MNPLDILTKLIENPRTSGGAIVAAIGIWLLTTFGTGPEGDLTIKYVALAITTIGVLFLGFGASDAKNTVLKSPAFTVTPTSVWGDLSLKCRKNGR